MWPAGPSEAAVVRTRVCDHTRRTGSLAIGHLARPSRSGDPVRATWQAPAEAAKRAAHSARNAVHDRQATRRPRPRPLADLRQEIDRIDEAMHRLLMERGTIIDRLIAVKKASGDSGSAFRPGREASMMRALAERHGGLLPLDTVEGIWRVIIATFTYVQLRYAVHADISGGDAPMRDSARFHFGFTVPYVTPSERRGGDRGGGRAPAAISASSASTRARPSGAWWRTLADSGRSEDHRSAALHRASRPSGRHAGLRHLQAPDRCGRARRGALRRPVRALAQGRERGADRARRRGGGERRRHPRALRAHRRPGHRRARGASRPR